MVKELLVGLAEVAFSAVVFFVERCSVLHTATSADSQVPADKALVTEILLGSGKLSLFTAGGKFFYRLLENITQSPLRLDKKIAAESIAGMLDYNILTALTVKRADRMAARDIIRQHRIEVADAQISRPIFVPAVKQPAQKVTVLLRRD